MLFLGFAIAPAAVRLMARKQEVQIVDGDAMSADDMES